GCAHSRSRAQFLGRLRSLPARPQAVGLAAELGRGAAPGPAVRTFRRHGAGVTLRRAGRTAMAYDLDQFIADCRTPRTRDPGPAGREEVRVRLERLLSNKDFVERYCGDKAPQGLKVLYEDPKLGFQILAHVNDKARKSPPHDHGASWAIYGQATLWT